MNTIVSQITSLTIVYSTVYSDADQNKHQSSASLAFVWGSHRGPVRFETIWRSCDLTVMPIICTQIWLLYWTILSVISNCLLWIDMGGCWKTPPTINITRLIRRPISRTIFHRNSNSMKNLLKWSSIVGKHIFIYPLSASNYEINNILNIFLFAGQCCRWVLDSLRLPSNCTVVLLYG